MHAWGLKHCCQPLTYKSQATSWPLISCYVCRVQGVQPKGPAVPANHGMGYHHAQAEGGYAFFMPNGEKDHRAQ